MTEPIRMPAVHVPLEHQSVPKEHEADRAIKEAAREIDEGKWISDDQSEQRDAAEGLGLSLGLGQEAAAVGEKPALSDFRETYERNKILDKLGRHPRVLEALEKAKHEISENKNPDLIEKNAALRELVMASEKGNRWDGQGRWMGHENEEMRYGRVLAPMEFFEQLVKVIGEGRLTLSEHLVYLREDKKSALSGIYKHNPKWDGKTEKLYHDDCRGRARALEDEAKKLQFDAELARKRGNIDKADRKVKEAARAAFEAIELLQSSENRMASEPEYIRVAAIQWPLTTEWMIMNFSEWGAVYSPRFFGWRTTLLSLIRIQAITEVEAHHAFPLEPGPAADWYEEQIYKFNHGPQTLLN